MDDTNKVRIFYEDCCDSGLSMLPPDANRSDYRFVPVPIKEIRYGLSGEKGVGENAIQSILGARNAGGPFKDLFDFCNRADRWAVNKRTVEALIRAGAFDTLEPNRGSLLAPVGMSASKLKGWPPSIPTRHNSLEQSFLPVGASGRVFLPSSRAALFRSGRKIFFRLLLVRR